MLLAHISDSHLGASPYGLAERERDFYEAFNEAIDAIIKEHADLVVHSGDIFDSPRPQGQALIEFLNGMKRLRDAGIRAMFTLGEHDISRVADVPAAMLFPSIGIAEYIGDGRPREHMGFTVIGHYKHRRSEIPSLLEKLRRSGELVRGKRGILVLHQALTELHRYAGEISESDLPQGFTYYALGHLHDRAERRLPGGAVAAYPGSLEATAVEGIRESEKGFYLVDLSGGEPALHWIRLQSVRPRLSYSLTYEELQREVDGMVERMSSMKKRPLVSVQVRVRGAEEAMARALIGRIASASLYCDPDVVDVSAASPVSIERPSDVGEEMHRLAAQVLKDEGLARFALEELLPRLSAGSPREAAEAMWSLYLKGLGKGDGGG